MTEKKTLEIGDHVKFLKPIGYHFGGWFHGFPYAPNCRVALIQLPNGSYTHTSTENIDDEN